MTSPDDADIKALIFDAQIGGLPQTLPLLPWEQGVFRPIFQDEGPWMPRLALPSLPPLPEDPKPSLRKLPDKRVRSASVYEQAVKARPVLAVAEETARDWQFTLGKWFRSLLWLSTRVR